MRQPRERDKRRARGSAMTADQVGLLRLDIAMMTQADFARLCGVHPVTVSRWESGTVSIGADRAESIRSAVANHLKRSR